MRAGLNGIDNGKKYYSVWLGAKTEHPCNFLNPFWIGAGNGSSSRCRSHEIHCDGEAGIRKTGVDQANLAFGNSVMPDHRTCPSPLTGPLKKRPRYRECGGAEVFCDDGAKMAQRRDSQQAKTSQIAREHLAMR